MTACSRDFSLSCASTLTAVSRRGRLLSATFVAAAIAPSFGYETTPAPAWLAMNAQQSQVSTEAPFIPEQGQTLPKIGRRSST